jgi:hypothetical protein
MLEAGIALSLFIFIMWWTLGPVKRREEREEALLRDADEIASPQDGER